MMIMMMLGDRPCLLFSEGEKKKKTKKKGAQFSKIEIYQTGYFFYLSTRLTPTSSLSAMRRSKSLSRCIINMQMAVPIDDDDDDDDTKSFCFFDNGK